MFILRTTSFAEAPFFFVRLRCLECDNVVEINTDKFETITPDCVILKDNINITCEKCGTSQPKDKKVIYFEPQTVAPKNDSVPNSKLPFWMTRDITSEELCRSIVVE